MSINISKTECLHGCDAVKKRQLPIELFTHLAGDMSPIKGMWMGVSMASPVVHFQIGGKDADKLRGFYQGVFGWNIDAPTPIGAIQTQAGVGINGGLHQVDENQSSYLAVYVAVADIVHAVEQAEAHGGTIIVAPTDVDGVGAFAMVQDPEGNCIGMWHNPDL
jgi:predicted enzyme related to lactoylglutathione lyase